MGGKNEVPERRTKVRCSDPSTDCLQDLPACFAERDALARDPVKAVDYPHHALKPT